MLDSRWYVCSAHASPVRADSQTRASSTLNISESENSRPSCSNATPSATRSKLASQPSRSIHDRQCGSVASALMRCRSPQYPPVIVTALSESGMSSPNEGCTGIAETAAELVICSVIVCGPISLQAASGHRRDDPVAEDDVEDDRRGDRDYRCRERQRIVRRIGTKEVPHADLHGLGVGVLGEDRREQKLVERTDHKKNRRSRCTGRRQRGHYAKEDRVEACAIDLGGLEDFEGRGVHVHLHDQEAERKEEPGIYERKTECGVVKVNGVHDEEDRRHQGIHRQQDAKQ